VRVHWLWAQEVKTKQGDEEDGTQEKKNDVKYSNYILIKS